MGFLRRIWAWLRYLLGCTWMVLRLPRPDVLVAYSPPLPTLWLAAMLAGLRRVPYLAEVADVWPNVPIEMGIVRNHLLKKGLGLVSGWAYRRARRVFVFSEDMIPLIAAYGVPAAQMRVVYNGVSGLPRPPRPVAARATVEVLYAGTIGIANDLTQVAQAAAMLQAQGRTDIHFSILGDGNDRKRVLQIAQSFDLQNISFLSPVPHAQAMAMIAAADIGLCCFAPFPVLESNGSSKFCDYLAAGTPVVLNYGGWQGKLVTAHRCGIAVPQGDCEALAQAIVILADTPLQERLCMGERGRALAENQFDRIRLAATMLAEIEAALR